ncbi:proteoglycan 4-like [Rhipicephalus sanguineus]|uniref:proteoglycan 4-like n=1 Tax=Rhipicephalus sanguineus TaxID=34632 RepID=UPI0020C1CE24|nr:proteoglycan 4-like [Rhipicephalus sanguineus]
MASGDLLLELKDLEQYDKLSHLVAFGNIPVSRTSFAEVVQRGPAPQRPLAVARTTRSVPRLTPLAPTVGAASAALPTPNQSTPVASAGSGSSRGNEEAKGVPSTSGLVGAKASSTVAKPTLSKHRSSSPSFADVTRRGAAPRLPAPAKVARSVTAVAPSAPPAGVACAAPPPPKEGQQTREPAGPKATASAVRPEAATNVPAERALPTTSEEVMDTTNTPPASQTPKERRSCLERAKKEKARITGPGTGSVT